MRLKKQIQEFWKSPISLDIYQTLACLVQDQLNGIKQYILRYSFKITVFCNIAGAWEKLSEKKRDEKVKSSHQEK